jgi:hypothetical protein
LLIYFVQLRIAVPFTPRSTVASGLDILTSFDLDGVTANGAALVQTVQQQVELSNFVVRGLI